MSRMIPTLLLTLPLSGQPLSVPCEPASDTIKLLEAVPPLRDTAIPYEQRVGALRILAQKHPEDFFVQRAYQDSFRQFGWLADEYDRALAMYRGRPTDPLSRYYEARLSMLSAPERSMKVFQELTAANPKFLWPRLDAMLWAVVPGARQPAQNSTSQREFQAACPEAFGAPFPVRAALERRNTPLELSAWPELWRIEESAGGPPKALADRIRADLARIGAWPFRADPGLYRAYEEAARILQDPSVLRDLRARVEREAPGSTLAFWFVRDDWEKANPLPDRNAPPAAGTEHRLKEAEAQREWLGRWPNQWSLLAPLLSGLDAQAASGGPFELSDRDLAIVDQALRVFAMSPDGGMFETPVEVTAARIYTAAKLRLDRVPDLLASGLRELGKANKYGPSTDLFPKELRDRVSARRDSQFRIVEKARMDYLMATGRPADARPLIEEVLSRPEQLKAEERAAWSRRLGDADAAEGRSDDALLHYRASLAGCDQNGLASIKQYYLAHGGTEASWPVWIESGPAAGTPQSRSFSFVKELPEFSATDLAGRTWGLANLKGKLTFVNFWATWCGPCRGEHPGVQELYDRIKSRADLQVVTFSVDDDDAAVRAYMTEKGYTFPVIRAPEVADRLFPYAGLPTNFVVNSQALRTSYEGFAPDSVSVGKFVEQMIQAVSR